MEQTFSEPIFEIALPLKEPTVLLDTPLFEESLGITFSEPVAEPLPYDNTESLELPFPFDETLQSFPYEEVPTEMPLVEPIDVTKAYECFVHKQSSYGLLDGKYLIRY